MSIGFNEEFDIQTLQKRLREVSDEKLLQLGRDASICVHQAQTWGSRRVKFSLFSGRKRNSNGGGGTLLIVTRDRQQILPGGHVDLRPNGIR